MTLFKGNSFDLLPFSFKNVAYCISKSMLIAFLFIHPVSNVEKKLFKWSRCFWTPAVCGLSPYNIQASDANSFLLMTLLNGYTCLK